MDTLKHQRVVIVSDDSEIDRRQNHDDVQNLGKLYKNFEDGEMVRIYLAYTDCKISCGPTLQNACSQLV